jgi:hypothetical protein
MMMMEVTMMEYEHCLKCTTVTNLCKCLCLWCHFLLSLREQFEDKILPNNVRDASVFFRRLWLSAAATMATPAVVAASTIVVLDGEDKVDQEKTMQLIFNSFLLNGSKYSLFCFIPCSE